METRFLGLDHGDRHWGDDDDRKRRRHDDDDCRRRDRH